MHALLAFGFLEGNYICVLLNEIFICYEPSAPVGRRADLQCAGKNTCSGIR